MSDQDFVIEIATTDYESTKAAVAGGADRIELCSALSEGGLTPSMALIQQCRRDFQVPIFPIIRPRSGDFLYSQKEFEIIKQDALFCKNTGCDGVVIGFLHADGAINKAWTSEIVEAVYPLEVTFHRAFDRCRDPFEALEKIIETGCQRLLTSGQQPTAMQGVQLIQQLIAQAAERIVIMPGSGVRADNIKVLATKTGAIEFHSSLQGIKQSEMLYRQPAFASSPESYSYPAITASDVSELRQALHVGKSSS
jgi:copper homeostasis protein